MTDNEKTIFCLIQIIFFPFALLLRGFVLTRLWHWFVVPLGVMEVTLWHAYGLVLALGLFIPKGTNYDPNEENSFDYRFAKSILFGFIMPLVVWFMGWICYVFM